MDLVAETLPVQGQAGAGDRLPGMSRPDPVDRRVPEVRIDPDVFLDRPDAARGGMAALVSIMLFRSVEQADAMHRRSCNKAV